MGNFKKYLDPKETKKMHVSLEKKRQNAPKKKTEILKNEPLKSVKMAGSTFKKLEMLKLATGVKYIDLMDEAITFYLEALKETNVQLRAMTSAYTEEMADGQMSIDDFL